jgi:hypothetical protein
MAKLRKPCSDRQPNAAIRPRHKRRSFHKSAPSPAGHLFDRQKLIARCPASRSNTIALSFRSVLPETSGIPSVPTAAGVAKLHADTLAHSGFNLAACEAERI